jgi:CHAD domain-containing protein
VDDLAAEKGDEASSSQALSEENQAKLREIFSLLQRDIQDQVRDVDVLEEILESITQELPNDIKTSLDPISQLEPHCNSEESLEESILSTNSGIEES